MGETRGAIFATNTTRYSLLVTRYFPVTPNPGPRPVAALGCFVLFAFGLISVVVLGATLSDAALTIILALVFVALILAFVRIVFRAKPPTSNE
jgi:hypothetical protein